jgi:predicted ATPase/DNA-binding CsgD family transcriptional regulator
VPKPKLLLPCGNLPTPLSSFIGREGAIAQVKQLLAGHRLVTLTGPGGSGKTRLAIRVAETLQGEYEDGIWFAELASISDGALVAQTVASCMNVQEHHRRILIDALAGYLSSRQVLLVIDNCEHLIQACAQFTDTILKKCPNLHILATSREMLGIEGESVWSVPPLTLPDQVPLKNPEIAPKTLIAYQQSEAIQLFVDRAALLTRDFSLNGENAAWISEICSRLDGMPLAIELAAARSQTLSVQQLAQRLDDRFHLLVGGSRTAPTRQQTLQAALDWSYGLLSEKEQLVLMRLSVFAGNISLEAAEEVCAGDKVEALEVLNLLARLMSKSLLTAIQLEHAERRYRLLETIRGYALEKLRLSNGMALVKNRLLEYYSRFLEAADVGFRGSDEAIWYKRVDDEYDNIRVALGWALESQNVDAAIDLARYLNIYWNVRGFLNEGIGWLKKALELRHFASRDSIATALRYLGANLLFIKARDLDQVGKILEESMNLYLNLEDKAGIAWVLNLKGLHAEEQKEYTKAKQFYNESLSLRLELGDPWFIAQTMQNFGPIFLQEHDYPNAKKYSDETIVWFQRAGYKRGVARTMGTLADITWMEGDLAGALKILKQSLSQLVEIGDKPSIADSLAALAIIENEDGHPKRAARLFGAAEALSDTLDSMLDIDREVYGKKLSAMREHLNQPELNQAWQEGRSMALDQIVEFVAQVSDSPMQIQTKMEPLGGLTARERETAVLIAQGKPNRLIANEMGVSVRTVETYVTRILKKLGFDSRVQIAAWAIENELKTWPSLK